MERDELITSFSRITTWGRGDQRAPHKPLLILYALACFQRGERVIPFTSANDALTRLLRDFGPPRKAIHTEYPFWRLQSDSIWRVESSTPMQVGADGTPTKREMLQNNAIGMFLPEVQEALKRDPSLIREAANQLLSNHFPVSLHEDICNAVGLDVAEERAGGGGRDPGFRQRVLKTYEYRCAVCGLQLLLSGTPIALEAAHIKWHQASGPAIIQNGLCLCVLHHKVFDLGAITLSSEHVVLVSDEVSGLCGLSEYLLPHHGKQMLRPIRSEEAPGTEYIEWHHREVFRGRSRPL